MPIPRATARLQLHKDFTLDDAVSVVDYYARLGISHLYLSPILTARPGSTHGYDIVDPTRINPELGGEAALRRLVEKVRAAGMGIVIDIVPNHMGVGGADNPWWLNVLEWGQHSRYARWFDIDWHSPDPTLNGKILLPFLGDQYAQALRSGDLRLQFDQETGLFHFAYYAHRFPLSPASTIRVLRHGGAALKCVASDFPEVHPEEVDAFDLHSTRAGMLRELAATEEGREGIAQALASVDPDLAGGLKRLHRLLERQNYKLTWWRNAAEEINWRRFFEVSDLAGVRVELDDVFDATHALIFRLYAEGLIDGVRVDHVDGLANPTAYCNELRQRLLALAEQRPPSQRDTHPYIVVEKILTRGERLHEDWAIDGTTGYEFMDQVGALLHSESGLNALNKLWIELTGDNDAFATHVLNARRQLLRENFVGEFAALTRAVHAVARTELDTRDISQAAIHRVLTEVLVAFPVYRTYGTQDGRNEVDRLVIERTLAEARRNLSPPDQPLLDTLITLFDTDSIDPDASPDALPLRQLAVRRFEQLTPPLAAKAVEDTGFYRYGRLLSRNEVGADPEYFSSSIADFHAFNAERAVHFPHAMLTTATHDHKRGEDVRARLAVLSEAADEWAETVRRWKRLHTDFRIRLVAEADTPEVVAPSLDDEIMLYQMILGAWPFELRADDQQGLQAYAERLAAWQEKALREAKRYSSWAMPNGEYESACREFLMALMDREKSAGFVDEMVAWVERVSTAGIANSLTQTLLRLTSPGMPDLYQGTEFWDFSLVDPDNRRPVHYDARALLLAQDGPAVERIPHRRGWHQCQLKQPLIYAALHLRKRYPALFETGAYIPLTVEGPLADHVIAFLRQHDQHQVLVVALRMSLHLLNEDLSLRHTAGDVPGHTMIQLPQAFHGDHVNLLTGKQVEVNLEQIDIANLLGDYPVALIAPRDA
ncbi:malto-oligosyltrehalose synthase [Oxalicibacterium faecigallinarum]|uniref:Malto-oligosyltrehalose synthase n=1 Tax=Oxalicibacterium faecigallinarum TaxID=573741 RepID=A0A8J3ASQ8_9BURK|nr:malto-oligosyltrehalose synthase [Oxalicibacterium faecigallinarum]GGI20962.1 malto-oligosyltrehalose synthase [Oxalicibacterium faecigallinarum]